MRPIIFYTFHFLWKPPTPCAAHIACVLMKKLYQKSYKTVLARRCTLDCTLTCKSQNFVCFQFSGSWIPYWGKIPRKVHFMVTTLFATNTGDFLKCKATDMSSFSPFSIQTLIVDMGMLNIEWVHKYIFIVHFFFIFSSLWIQERDGKNNFLDNKMYSNQLQNPCTLCGQIIKIYVSFSIDPLLYYKMIKLQYHEILSGWQIQGEPAWLLVLSAWENLMIS